MRRLNIIKKIALTGLFIIPFLSQAQSPFKGLENLFTTPLNYTVEHTDTPPVIDGNINDAIWQKADWTQDFQDIEGDLKPQPPLKTRVKMLWDDSCLYIAAQLQEPQVSAFIKAHDDVVYHDNDIELFIDPTNTTHQYFEFEVNPINTVFDLFMNKPYRDGGSAMISWDARGLRTAVKVQGTMNDPSDVDKGWTVEIAIPFSSLYLGNSLAVPTDSTLWRINFSRVEWDNKVVNGKYVKETDANGNPRPEHNWVWTPQGIVNMHAPERWGYLKFTRNDDSKITFSLPYEEMQKRYLWLVYYRERLWEKEHKKFLTTLQQLGLSNSVTVDGRSNSLKLEATDHQFIALITDKKEGVAWTINKEGLIQKLVTGKDE